MKKLYLFLVGALITCSVFAQSAPVLPKEWKGEISGTSQGVAHPLNPNQSAKGWNAFDEPRGLTIVRQEGRHLEMVLTHPRGEEKWIGTISKNGKQIQITTKSSSYLLDLSESTLSGCGSSRGSGGTFDHWISNYSSLCFDFKAVK